ncbi:hypothetical protein [Haladaptatus cibarius]|uniref:hypothetical protein n=1 Tax=Haladaptatus cibarius TaxID=453847 RepID=UPI000679B1B0|nr:hypothetical protein [Haladaptatus cibarius]
MTDWNRRSILAVVGAVVSTAGCVSDLGGKTTTTPPQTEPTQTATTTKATSETTTEETTLGDWWVKASKEPNPDHSISLWNRGDEQQTVRVRVVRRATDETVFDERYDIGCGGVRRTLYNLKDANPEGVEGFSICAEFVESAGTRTTTGNQSETKQTTASDSDATESQSRGCVSISTNECYGDVDLIITEEGSIDATYAIC